MKVELNLTKAEVEMLFQSIEIVMFIRLFQSRMANENGEDADLNDRRYAALSKAFDQIAQQLDINLEGW